MPQGQVIGRVSVRVLPDTSDFRKKAQDDLDRIEKRLAVEIPAKPVMTGFLSELLKEIREINRQNRSQDSRKIRLHTKLSLSNVGEELRKAIRRYEDAARSEKVSLKTRLDTTNMDLKVSEQSLRRMTDQLKDWRDDISPLKIQVEPDVAATASAAVSARLEALTRPRTVSIVPVLNNAAVAKVATALSALSGARVLNNVFEKFSNILKNLDKNVPIIGALAAAVAGVAAWGLTAASNLAALSASLAQIGAVTLTLPGLLGGFVIGLGLTVAALKDFNREIPNVSSELKRLQDRVSANFWEQAREPIQALVDDLLPRFAKGFRSASTEIGRFFGSLAVDLTAVFDPSLVDDMFGYLNESIQTATGGTKTFASIIAQLGEVGASYLPNLAGWFVDISKQFDVWLEKKGQLGLQDEINAGIQSLKDLAGVLYNTGGIFAGIARAAEEAGGSTLGILNETLKSIHETVDSPAFQAGLVDVFSAAHQAMSNLATQAGPAVKSLFVELGKLLTTVLPQAGTIIGTALGAIADALAQPAVTQGVTAMFDALSSAVQALAPAMAPLGQALGAIMQVVAAMLPVFAQLVAAAVVPLANGFARLAPAIIPIVQLLGGALTQAFVALKPILQEVLPDAIGRVIGALQPLLQALLSVVNVVLPVLVPVLGFLIEVLADSLVGAINGVTQVLEGFKTFFVGVWDYLVGYFKIIWGVFEGIFTGDWNTFKEGWAQLWRGIQGMFSGIWDVLIGLLKTYLNVGILGAAGKAFTALRALFSSAWKAITKIFTGAFAEIRGYASLFFTGAGRLVSDGMKAVGKFFSDGWKAVTGYVRLFFTGARKLVSDGLSAIGRFFSSAWSSIRSTTSSAWSRLVSTVSSWIGRAVAKVRELPGKAKSALGSLGSALVNAGKSLIRGFINGITSMFGSVKSKLSSLTSKLKDWKGPEALDRVLLVDAGRLVIDGFIKGLESRYDAVRKSLQGLTDDVASMQFEVPAANVRGVSGGMSAVVTGALSGSAGGGTTKILNYYAAPGSSISSEEDLFAAASRARFGW